MFFPFSKHLSLFPLSRTYRRLNVCIFASWNFANKKIVTEVLHTSISPPVRPSLPTRTRSPFNTTQCTREGREQLERNVFATDNKCIWLGRLDTMQSNWSHCLQLGTSSLVPIYIEFHPPFTRSDSYLRFPTPPAPNLLWFLPRQPPRSLFFSSLRIRLTYSLLPFHPFPVPCISSSNFQASSPLLASSQFLQSRVLKSSLNFPDSTREPFLPAAFLIVKARLLFIHSLVSWYYPREATWNFRSHAEIAGALLIKLIGDRCYQSTFEDSSRSSF